MKFMNIINTKHNKWILIFISMPKKIVNNFITIDQKLVISYNLQVAFHQQWESVSDNSCHHFTILAHGMCMHWWPLSFTKDCGKHFGTQEGNCQHCRLSNGSCVFNSWIFHIMAYLVSQFQLFNFTWDNFTMSSLWHDGLAWKLNIAAPTWPCLAVCCSYQWHLI